MPILSMFYGIIIRMYFEDHNPPHIHAEYNGQKVSINLDGEIEAGALPRKQIRLVQAWIEIHSDELRANWELSRNNETLFKIDPLK